MLVFYAAPLIAIETIYFINQKTQYQIKKTETGFQGLGEYQINQYPGTQHQKDDLRNGKKRTSKSAFGFILSSYHENCRYR